MERKVKFSYMTKVISLFLLTISFLLFGQAARADDYTPLGADDYFVPESVGVNQWTFRLSTDVKSKFVASSGDVFYDEPFGWSNLSVCYEDTTFTVSKAYAFENFASMTDGPEDELDFILTQKFPSFHIGQQEVKTSTTAAIYLLYPRSFGFDMAQFTTRATLPDVFRGVSFFTEFDYNHVLGKNEDRPPHGWNFEFGTSKTFELNDWLSADVKGSWFYESGTFDLPRGGNFILGGGLTATWGDGWSARLGVDACLDPKTGNEAVVSFSVGFDL